MASGRTKTIEEIDDLGDMLEAMAALHISASGLQTLDEMKDRVRTELNQSLEKPSWTAGQVRLSRQLLEGRKLSWGCKLKPFWFLQFLIFDMSLVIQRCSPISMIIPSTALAEWDNIYSLS